MVFECENKHFMCVHTTLCNSMDRSPPGSSVDGIFQARIWRWVSIKAFHTFGLNLNRKQNFIYFTCVYLCVYLHTQLENCFMHIHHPWNHSIILIFLNASNRVQPK